MALNGIDISNYQRGLDLAQVPCDFVICKATEGTTIVHNTCDPWIQQAIKLGKLWGFYHFMNEKTPSLRLSTSSQAAVTTSATAFPSRLRDVRAHRHPTRQSSSSITSTIRPAFAASSI